MIPIGLRVCSSCTLAPFDWGHEILYLKLRVHVACLGDVTEAVLKVLHKRDFPKGRHAQKPEIVAVAQVT